MRALRQAFSLIELLIVVAIMAILLGVGAPYFQKYRLEAQITRVEQDIDTLAQAVIRYEHRQGHLLTGDSLLPMQGLVIQTVPKDPWGNTYFFDGQLAIIGSMMGQEMGVETRPVITQYTTYLGPKTAELAKGGFGQIQAGVMLRIHMNKPFHIPAGGEALIPYDLHIVAPSEPPLPIPAAAFGFEYDPSFSEPPKGRIMLRVITAPASPLRLTPGSGIAMDGFTLAIQEVYDPTETYHFDPLPYLWGTEPPGDERPPVKIKSL